MLSVVLIESERTQERTVSCFGALDIVMRGGQPEFRSFHLSAAGMGGPDALCERLAELSADRHIILGQPAIHGDFWDWQELLSTGSLFVSSIRPCEDLQPSGLSGLSLAGGRLNEISERMKLSLTRQTRSLEAARLAPSARNCSGSDISRSKRAGGLAIVCSLPFKPGASSNERDHSLSRR